MGVLQPINSFFSSVGIPENFVPICAFLFAISIIVGITALTLTLLNRKKIIGGATKSFYLFVTPWIIGFFLFTFGPMVFSLYISFQDWELVREPVWAGLGNYRKMAEDPLVKKSLSVTFTYTLTAVPLQVICAFLIAAVMNVKMRGIRIFRTIFYLPNLVQGVAQMVLFLWVFNPSVGLVNSVLDKMGLEGPGWFSDPAWSLPAIVIMSLWTVGGNMIIYLAGFQDISTSLYEQASVDGARTIHKFFYITIPQMTPIIFFNMITAMIGAFQTFTQGYLNDGGIDNSLLFYSYYLYKNAFMWFKMGYGSALAWLLFVIIMFFTIMVFKSSSVWVYYEKEMSPGRRKKDGKNKKQSA